MDSPLVLISSYPKSGNTWVRSVFQGILAPETAGDINRIQIGVYGPERRRLFDFYAPAEASELTPVEIDRLLPSVWEEYAEDAPSAIFLKVHDIAGRNDRGAWLYPPEVVRVALCLVRHPFDVAASFANHMGWSMEETVQVMREGGRWDFQPNGRLPQSLQEWGGGWSQHVASWLAPDLPYRRVVLRYEDLCRDPLAGFSTLAEAAGLPTDERLRRAVEASTFDRLQMTEKNRGFRETPRTSEGFFRMGGSMTWKTTLSASLQAELVHDHREMMDRLGYLSAGVTIFP